MFSQVRYRCEHLLNYGTGTVLYCTELRPLSCLYEYSTSTCTTVLQSYRTLLQSLFSVLVRVRVEVQYSSVSYVFSHKYGTVVHIYLETTTVRVPYRSVRYSGPSLAACTCTRTSTRLYCTVLYAYRTVFQTIFPVLVFVSSSYRYEYSFCSSKSCKQCRYSTVRVVYSSRTVSYRSTVLE